MTHIEGVTGRIQQLCCLGLGGQAIMPTLLKELHALVPSHDNMFSWVDENYQVSNMCFESPTHVEVAPIYLSEFYNKRESEVYLTFPAVMKLQHGVENWERWLKVDKRSFLNHDYYNLIFRPLGVDHFLNATIRDDSRALGLLLLLRAKSDPEFTEKEKSSLSGILPHIAHGLTTFHGLQHDWTDSEEAGFMVLNRQGDITHMSTYAKKLLFLAAYPEISPRFDLTQTNTPIMAKLRELCSNLRSVFEERTATRPPVYEHHNAWGRFILRAYWLNDVNPWGYAYMGVTIMLQVPRSIGLMRQLADAPLSQAQARLCLGLAMGKSYAEIGQHMGKSEVAVAAECKRIYEKLNVQGRQELIEKLGSL